MTAPPSPLSMLKQALTDRDDLQVRFIVGDVPVAQRNQVIRECCVRDDAEGLAWMGVGRLTEEQLYAAIEANALKVVRQTLPETVQAAWWNPHQALVKAVRGAGTAMLGLLTPHITPDTRNNDALIEAIRKEREDLVTILLPLSVPTHHASRALREALLVGHHGILERLAPRSNAAEAGEALIQATTTVTDGRAANVGQFTDEQRWAAVDYLGPLVDAAQRHRWLATHGDTKLPGIARQVLSELRLSALDERPAVTDRLASPRRRRS